MEDTRAKKVMKINNKTTAKDLYLNDNSPVQFGSRSSLLKFVKNNVKNKENYLRLERGINNLSKEITLGTHFNKKYKKIGQYHYSLNPNKNGFFESDLLDLTNLYKKYNKGYRYVLFLENGQTKYLRYELLKTKNGLEVAKKLKKYIKNDN